MYKYILLIWDKFWLFINIFRKRVLATKCGHLTHRFIEIMVHGERAIYNRTHGEEVDYCGDCLTKMAIPCAKCYKVIFVGNRIQPFILDEGDIPIQRRDHVKKCDGGYVCCISMDCAGGGIAGGSGIWVAPGKVKKISM